MDEAKRKTWAAALRSGRYKQAQGLLRNARGDMCCLGVAIDTFCSDRWVHHDGEWLDGAYGVGDPCIPIEETRERLDLTHSEAQNLAELNDESGLSFTELAKFIETHDRLDGDPDEADKELHGGSNRTG